jgi:hypothetical protein
MGSNGLISEEKPKVEHTSLTETFEELCPIFMSYGMSYDEYWYGSPYRAKFYLQAHKIKIKQKDEELWMQGMYIYEALCDVSPILHAFSKNGTKPLPYTEKPFLHNEETLMSEEEKEQKRKNDELIARIHFENLMRDIAKRFENKNT